MVFRGENVGTAQDLAENVKEVCLLQGLGTRMKFGVAASSTL